MSKKIVIHFSTFSVGKLVLNKQGNSGTVETVTPFDVFVKFDNGQVGCYTTENATKFLTPVIDMTNIAK